MELKTVVERYHPTGDEPQVEEIEDKNESLGEPVSDVQLDAVDSLEQRPGFSLSKRGIAFATLIALGAVAAIFGVPQNIRSLLHRTNEAKVVGVPEAGGATAPQSPKPPIQAQAEPVANNSPPPAAVPPVPAVEPVDSTVAKQELNSQPPAAVTQDAFAGAAVASSEFSTRSSSNAKQPEASIDSTAKAVAKPRPVISTNRPLRSMPYQSLHPGSVRARVVGRTPNGNLILLLPSGETAVVASPAREFGPRCRPRYFTERPDIFVPPPFPPGY